MKLRKIWMTVLLIVVVGLLASCKPKVPNEAQIEKDLPDMVRTITIGYDEDYENILLDVEEVAIDKRQTNEKDDTVYCTITSENEEYRCIAEWVLYYNYYDKGGWILDESELLDAQIIPLCGVPQSVAETEMAKYYFDSIVYKSQELKEDEESYLSNCFFDAVYERANCSLQGTVVLSYYLFREGMTTVSWKSELKFVDSIQWDILGTWTGKESLLIGEEEITLDILSFDGNELEYRVTTIYKEPFFDEIKIKKNVYSETVSVVYGNRYIYDVAEEEQRYMDLNSLSFKTNAGWERTVRIFADGVSISGTYGVPELYRNQSSQINEDNNETILTSFYGIWCDSSKAESEAQKAAESLVNKGIDAQIFLTTDWANLNTEKWYVVSAGVYDSKEKADAMLSKVKEVYPDAYVKYSGDYLGN